MCGRFNLVADGEQLALAFDLDDIPSQIVPRYNIAPTQPVVGIRHNRAGERELTHFHWGLIPSWAKDPKMASRMINARSETAAEKPAFRAAYKRRRCIIPVSGFYEWQKIGSKKQPMHIHHADNAILAFAGLWESWNEVESCTILTMAPNEMMSEFHHRMPVILEKEDFDLWLDVNAPLPALPALFKPYPSEKMSAYAVSTYVNRPINEGPECIEAI